MNKFQNILGQAKKMQDRMLEAQKNLSSKTVEANAGGGMVSVVANGRNQIVSVRIDPDVVSDGDVEMLEDLVLAGVNEALRKSQALMTEEMSKITGGMAMPGLLNINS